jgi:hypothetical protein
MQLQLQLQLQRLEQSAPPGVASLLVRKLLAFDDAAPRVEVVMLSRNDPVPGLRISPSARHYGLPMQRGVFTRGQPPWRYLPSMPDIGISNAISDRRTRASGGLRIAEPRDGVTRSGLSKCASRTHIRLGDCRLTGLQSSAAADSSGSGPPGDEGPLPGGPRSRAALRR